MLSGERKCSDFKFPFCGLYKYIQVLPHSGLAPVPTKVATPLHKYESAWVFSYVWKVVNGSGCPPSTSYKPVHPTRDQDISNREPPKSGCPQMRSARCLMLVWDSLELILNDGLTMVNNGSLKLE